MYRANLPGGAVVEVTTKNDGDFARPERAANIVTVHQIHGNQVLVVPGGTRGELGEADALVSEANDVVLGVRGADCPLIGLVGGDVIGAVHAGWRGLLAGVIQSAAAAMRSLGAIEITAVLGPYIGAECYAFSPDDFAAFVERFGSSCRSTTTDGEASLDLGRCIEVELGRAEIGLHERIGDCTASAPDFYSWRARAESGRHALLISKRESLERV